MSSANEPAMPLYDYEQWVDAFDPSKGTYEAHGLTKREYFAGLAMQGLLTDSSNGVSLRVYAIDAKRYQWLRDNGHLNSWWSVEGPQDRCENIDSDIDAAREGRGHE